MYQQRRTKRFDALTDLRDLREKVPAPTMSRLVFVTEFNPLSDNMQIRTGLVRIHPDFKERMANYYYSEVFGDNGPLVAFTKVLVSPAPRPSCLEVQLPKLV